MSSKSNSNTTSNDSSIDNRTSIPTKGSIASQKPPTRPELPLPVFGPPPKLGEGPSYDPTPDGNVPEFVPISMPVSLTRFEIGAIKPKYVPKHGSKAYLMISPKGNGIQATTTDGDGNKIASTTLNAYFDLRRKTTFLRKLKTKWLKWHKAVQDVDQEIKIARERVVQKIELEPEIEYAIANHPEIPRSEIDKHARTVQKLREKYPRMSTPELSDLIQLIQEYIQLGADPGLTPDFFVLNQTDYWVAKGKSDSDKPFDSKKDFLVRMYSDEVKRKRWVDLGVIELESPDRSQKTAVKRKRSDKSFVVTKKMWKSMQRRINELEEKVASN